MDIEKRVTEAFRELGERHTQPRQVIAENLIRLGRTGDAFSVEDLVATLRKGSPRIGRATVYRSVEKLVHLHVLDRIDFADGTHRYRLCGVEGHHHHLACTRCHRVVVTGFCLSDADFEDIGKKAGFSVEDHALTIFGLCRECRRQES